MAAAFLRGVNKLFNNFLISFFHIAGVASPVRSSEKVIELIYEAHLRPGLRMAPYFQYVIRPSGGIPNPTDPTGVLRIGDAAVFDVTITLRY